MGKNYLLVAFKGFLISFIVYLFIPESLLKIHLDPGDLHVHHFVYGILILAIGYPLAVYKQSHKAKWVLSLLYGFGLFLIVDEVQQWLWLSQTMDDHHPLRYLPGIMVIGIFLLALLIQGLKNVIKK